MGESERWKRIADWLGYICGAGLSVGGLGIFLTRDGFYDDLVETAPLIPQAVGWLGVDFMKFVIELGIDNLGLSPESSVGLLGIGLMFVGSVSALAFNRLISKDNSRGGSRR